MASPVSQGGHPGHSGPIRRALNQGGDNPGGGTAEAHQTGGMHQERLKTLTPPVNVEAAVQVLRRERPGQLVPETRALNKPSGGHAAASNDVQGPAGVAAQTPSTSVCPTPLVAPVSVEEAHFMNRMERTSQNC
ncbi:hypothetical protein IscW_ISCW023270 [Ixodes scapularis]|uniref:Uncharacterized protein n=1 Tax=Ixodes scapularis TaxID=6945 RepID=B7QJW0_IXOSC|nr:hypothetical protein IscW_ISCW023270 [Ixodes scapularis]|eukprot:XP_002415467.1 hypothetical protein IscW_ISCW023270 [Ixodes scapularis]